MCAESHSWFIVCCLVRGIFRMKKINQFIDQTVSI